MVGGDIVLCAGAMGTPQVLELSGIGPKAVLEGVGVPVVADLPAVGENLQDHLAVHMQHRCTQPVSLVAMRQKYRWPLIAAQWLVAGSGPGATPTSRPTASSAARRPKDRPDIMISFAALAMRSEEGAQVEGHVTLMTSRPTACRRRPRPPPHQPAVSMPPSGSTTFLGGRRMSPVRAPA